MFRKDDRLLHLPLAGKEVCSEVGAIPSPSPSSTSPFSFIRKPVNLISGGNAEPTLLSSCSEKTTAGFLLSNPWATKGLSHRHLPSRQNHHGPHRGPWDSPASSQLHCFCLRSHLVLVITDQINYKIYKYIYLYVYLHEITKWMANKAK